MYRDAHVVRSETGRAPRAARAGAVLSTVAGAALSAPTQDTRDQGNRSLGVRRQMESRTPPSGR